MDTGRHICMHIDRQTGRHIDRQTDIATKRKNEKRKRERRKECLRASALHNNDSRGVLASFPVGGAPPGVILPLGDRRRTCRHILLARA